MKGNRIAALRKEYGLNQKELGERLGVGQTTISAWETGRNDPDSKSLLKMAQLFEVSVDYLMGQGEESYLRGLSEAEFREIQKKRKQRRDEEKFERLIAQEDAIDEVSGLTDQEMRLIEWEDSKRRFLKGETSDTLEGFMASEIIDSKPEAERTWLLALLEKAANHP